MRIACCPPPSPRSQLVHGATDSLHRSQALLYGKLAGEVLDRRRQRRYDPESLELSARLLSLNPEVYTVWNYRCVLHLAKHRSIFCRLVRCGSLAVPLVRAARADCRRVDPIDHEHCTGGGSRVC